MSRGLSEPLNRAQRRFLGLTLPIGALEKRDYFPIEEVGLSSTVLRMLTQHQQGAGQLRGGTLLGFYFEERLSIEVVLPSKHTYQHPFAMEPEYLLGALDAISQVNALPLDWVGNWVMPADGRQPDPCWTEQMWHTARQQALVAGNTVLLTVGMAEDRLEAEAWCEREGEPYKLTVVKSLGFNPKP